MEFGKKLLLPKPELILATKINSIKNRDKEHKRIKDLCDIAAITLYSGTPINKLINKTKNKTKQKINIEQEDIEKTSDNTQIPKEIIKNIIEQINQT